MKRQTAPLTGPETAPPLPRSETDSAPGKGSVAAPALGEDYLYAAHRVRFELEPEDQLIAAPDLSFHQVAEKTHVRASSGASCVVALPLPVVRAALASLSELVPLGTWRQRVTASAQAQEQLLQAALGRVVFCPLAVYELERRVCAAEITRFAVSPYEVARAYWRNMAAVRERCDAQLAAVDGPQSLCEWLQQLHRLALLGEDGSNVYLPLSPIARGGTHPGQLLEAPTVLEETARGTKIVSGPRINAAMLGGQTYHALLHESVGEPLQESVGEPLTAVAEPASLGTWARAVVPEGREASGLTIAAWGELRSAYAHEELRSYWFIPPRPMLPQHWAALYTALDDGRRAARSGYLSETCRALALFHQGFIRLHPFHCGNQSLVMNLVGAVLRSVTGAGIPHLVLDHLAFRLSVQGYACIFERAVRYYARGAQGLVLRYRTLAEDRERVYGLLQQLQTMTVNEGRLWVQGEPSAARAALLVS